MKKEFTKFELARLKRTAQNVDQYLKQKHKLVEKIATLQAELENVQRMIDLTDAPTVMMTGGYTTEQIIKKVVTPTDQVTKNGDVIKKVTYEFIYPETIIPVETVEEAVVAEEIPTEEIDTEIYDLNPEL